MKCMAIKLLENKQCHKTIKSEQQQQQKFVFPKSLHSYTFSFIKNRSIKPPKSPPSLSVTNLTLPEDTCFNTGASLERWKCKSPRWKSAKIFKFLPKDDEDFCYETLESSSYFFSVEDESQSRVPSPVDPDIQELIMKTECSQNSVECVSGNGCKGKKSRKKSKKKIKFSLTTSPPSPATEQIIRVDVTSTVEECCREGNENEQYGMIDDERKELKGNLNRGEREEMYGGGGGGGDDFIVRSRQLALKQRHR